MSSRKPISRFVRRAIVGVAVATGLAVTAPIVASAHVGVSPDAIEEEGSAVLTFSFTHGCEDSPTTALRITMPEGLTSVAPTADGAWDIDVERAGNGLVSAVTYTAINPVPSHLRGAATMAVRLGDDAPDTLAFPVEQQCENGALEWVEIAAEGTDPHDLESPAPVVTVAATGDEGESAGALHDHSDSHRSDEAASVSADPLSAVLAGVGLVVAVVALVVAALAYRRAA